MPSLADLLNMGKNYVKDALPGGLLNPEVTSQGILDGAALSTTAVPVLGDLLGLGADLNRYKNEPESRTLGNFALSGLGMLPFVPNAVGMFAGKGAKTADLAKQGLAEKMLSAGDDPAKVWKETGWGVGPDGKWRFEIPDNKSFYRGSKALGGGSKAEDLYLHNDLYDAYPGLANNRISEFDGFGGATDNLGRMSIGVKGGGASTTAHEMQHDIQNIEGFAIGGNPSSFKNKAIPKNLKDKAFNRDMTEMAISQRLQNSGIPVSDGKYHSLSTPQVMNAANELAKTDPLVFEYLEKYKQINNELSKYPTARQQYQSLGGEAEARLTQSRMNMDAPQRAAQYPWEPTYFEQATGVPLSGLLYRYD